MHAFNTISKTVLQCRYKISILVKTIFKAFLNKVKQLLCNSFGNLRVHLLLESDFVSAIKTSKYFKHIATSKVYELKKS